MCPIIIQFLHLPLHLLYYYNYYCCRCVVLPLFPSKSTPPSVLVVVFVVVVAACCSCWLLVVDCWFVFLCCIVCCIAVVVVCLHNGYQISIVNLHLNIAIILLLDHALIGRIIPGSIHALRRWEAQLHDEWEFCAYIMRVDQRWTWVKKTKWKGIERMHSYRINGVPLLLKSICFFFL